MEGRFFPSFVPALAFLALAAPSVRGQAPEASQPAAAPQETLVLPKPADSGAVLSWEQVLRKALEAHPGLEAGRRAVAAREAAEGQAARPLNPALEAEVEDMAGTGAYRGFGAAQSTVRLSQTVEWGGKRRGRREVAGGETALARAELRGRESEVRRQARAAWLEAAEAQARKGLAEAAAATSGALLESVTRRIREGGASPADGIRARMAVAGTGLDGMRAGEKLLASKRRLASLWGGTADSLGALQADLETLPSLPAAESLAAHVAASPAAEARAKAVSLAEAKARREEGLSAPDMTVSAGIRHFAGDGDGALVAGVSLPLPLLDRNRDGRREAEEEVRRARAENRAADLEAEAGLAEILGEMAAARKEAEALRKDLIPAADEAASVLAEGYRRGRFGILEVLSAEGERYQYRLRYLETLARCHKAHAAWEGWETPSGTDGRKEP